MDTKFESLGGWYSRSCVYGFLASPRASFLLCAHFCTFKLVLMKALETMASAIPNQVMSSYLTAFGSVGAGVVAVMFGMRAGARFPSSFHPSCTRSRLRGPRPRPPSDSQLLFLPLAPCTHAKHWPPLLMRAALLSLSKCFLASLLSLSSLYSLLPHS